jgi:subtilisin family serine protease
MRARNFLLPMLAVLTGFAMADANGAFAQGRYQGGGARHFSERPPPPNRGDGGMRGSRGHHGPFRRHHGGFGAGGIIIGLPALIESLPSADTDNGIEQPVHRRTRTRKPRAPRRAARRTPSGAPPAGETRLVPDEVVVSLRNTVRAAQINALQRRYRLQRLESHRSQLAGVTLYRWRIPDRRSVATVVRALERNRLVSAAQPNYVFTLQRSEKAAADSAQYELAKLHLPQAHTLATGDNVKVAIIDSAVDLHSPELNGSVVASFDTLKTPPKPHAHGTAIAGLIAAHGKLTGAAPDAKLLAVRAFDPDGDSARGTTFNILRGLDWAVANGARVINMSFAGPADPIIHRALTAADRKNIVLVAAAGNAGPKSPPLYPAADPHVIAVTATDASDALFARSNRGKQIALAAPGADILVAAPNGGVALSSGTSYSAAEVSGIVALLLQRRGNLTPAEARRILMRTAEDLGRKGRDPEFGAGLVNAYEALIAEAAPVTAAVPLPVSRANSRAP